MGMDTPGFDLSSRYLHSNYSVHKGCVQICLPEHPIIGTFETTEFNMATAEKVH